MVGVDDTVEEIRVAANAAVDSLLSCEAILAQEKFDIRHSIQKDLIRLRDTLRSVKQQIDEIETVRKLTQDRINRFPGLGADDY